MPPEPHRGALRERLCTGRAPTEKQTETLRALGSGAAGLAMRKRTVDPLLRRGWVTAEWREPFYSWVRITPEGLCALAEGVRRYGLPELGPKPVTTRRVCADCGGHRYRYVDVPAEEIAHGR